MITKLNSKCLFCVLFIISFSLSLLLSGCSKPENETKKNSGSEKSISIIVSTTDLQGISEAVVGDMAKIICFSKGNQDPHQLDILPSYVREMNDADLWIQVGNDIEASWYSNLMANVTNTNIVMKIQHFLLFHTLFMK